MITTTTYYNKLLTLLQNAIPAIATNMPSTLQMVTGLRSNSSDVTMITTRLVTVATEQLTGETLDKTVNAAMF